MNSRSAAFVAAALAALALGPPVWALLAMGPHAIFGHFAADSFYYLTIARNAIDGPFPSFDGVRPTNGFHPLWQAILAGLFQFVGRDQTAQLTAAYLAGAGLTAAGVVFFGWAVLRATGSRWAPLALVPGFFAVAFTPSAMVTKDLGLTYTASVWAFMNGMESPLTILAAGVLAFLLSSGETSRRRDLAIGVVLAFATLSRLDDGLLVAAFAAAAMAGPGSARSKAARTLRLAGPAAFAVGGYAAWSLAATGMALPASAAAKVQLALVPNLRALAADLVPAVGPLPHLVRWATSAQRTMLLFAPAVLGAVLLVTRRRFGWPATLAPFTPLLAFVVLKCVFFLAAVGLMSQGYWAMSSVVAIVNFALVLVVHAVAAAGEADVPGGGRTPRFAPRPVAILGVTAWALLYLFTSANALHRVASRNWWFDVWCRRAEIRAGLLARVPEPKLLELYDGLFAYSFELPTMTVTGYVADRAGRSAMAEESYLEYCVGRGHDITVTGPKAYSLPLKWFPKISRGDPQVLFEDESTGVQFLRLQLLPDAARRAAEHETRP